jgi:hypothetical protein
MTTQTTSTNPGFVSRNVTKTVVDVPLPPAETISIITHIVTSDKKAGYTFGRVFHRSEPIAELFSKEGVLPSQFEFSKDHITGRAFFRKNKELFMVEQVDMRMFDDCNEPFQDGDKVVTEIVHIERHPEGFKYGQQWLHTKSIAELQFPKGSITFKAMSTNSKTGIAYFKKSGQHYMAVQSYISRALLPITSIMTDKMGSVIAEVKIVADEPTQISIPNIIECVEAQPVKKQRKPRAKKQA